MLLSASCKVTCVMINYLLTEQWCSIIDVMQYKCTCFWWTYITFGIIPCYKSKYYDPQTQLSSVLKLTTRFKPTQLGLMAKATFTRWANQVISTSWCDTGPHWIGFYLFLAWEQEPILSPNCIFIFNMGLKTNSIQQITPKCYVVLNGRMTCALWNMWK